MRPTMRFVAVTSGAQQASATSFEARDLLVRQRSNTVNALCGQIAEFGLIAPKSIAQVGRLEGSIDDSASSLPDPVRGILRDRLGVIRELSQRIDELDRKIRQRANNDDVTERLVAIPGIGPAAPWRRPPGWGRRRGSVRPATRPGSGHVQDGAT
jgi:transposase